MKKMLCQSGLILLVTMTLLSCGKVYKKGNLGLKIVKAEWKEIYIGDSKTQDKYLVAALDIYSPGPNDRPNLSMSVRDESGDSYPQGSSTYTYHGRRTRVDTCFLLTKIDKKLYLIAGDFDPIPISPE